MKDKILKIIYGLFFAVVIAIVLLLIASKLPLPGNFNVLVVQSGSMEPAIKTGAVVVVKPTAEYKVGDIITYVAGGRNSLSITHRIIEIKKNNNNIVYITKGDANDSIDMAEVSYRRIIGKVRLNIPYVGYAVAAAKKPMGFLFIIVVPAILIIYDEIVKVYKEMKKIRVKKNEDKSKDSDEKNTE